MIAHQDVARECRVERVGDQDLDAHVPLHVVRAALAQRRGRPDRVLEPCERERQVIAQHRIVEFERLGGREMLEEAHQARRLVDLVVVLIEEHHEDRELVALAAVHGLDGLGQRLDVPPDRLAPRDAVRPLVAVAAAEVVDPQHVVVARLQDRVPQLVVELVVEDVADRVRARERLADQPAEHVLDLGLRIVLARAQAVIERQPDQARVVPAPAARPGRHVDTHDDAPEHLADGRGRGRIEFAFADDPLEPRLGELAEAAHACGAARAREQAVERHHDLVEDHRLGLAGELPAERGIAAGGLRERELEARVIRGVLAGEVVPGLALVLEQDVEPAHEHPPGLVRVETLRREVRRQQAVEPVDRVLDPRELVDRGPRGVRSDRGRRSPLRQVVGHAEGPGGR